MEQRHAKRRPQQARSRATEQKLLDGLVNLLSEKAFDELTVAELAREADVTTGAIYRRFDSKEGLLRAALERIQWRPQWHEIELIDGGSDTELLRTCFQTLLQFALQNAPLLRAAETLDGTDALVLMSKMQSDSADWLATRISGSDLPPEELTKRIQLILSVAAATIRETVDLQTRALPLDDSGDSDGPGLLEGLASELAEMASSYLETPSPARTP